MHFAPSQKSSLKKFIIDHRKKFLNTLLFLAVIFIGFLGFWFASKVILNAEYPMLPVSSRNMCLVQNDCDNLMHPFEPTLHVGDLIIVQGVDARSVRDAYPDSDILVFHSPKSGSYENDELIITRVVAKEERNGTIYFRTKSDGEGVHKWPEIPTSIDECDRWNDYRENYTWDGLISEKLLVGKAVFRVPWVGHIGLFMQTPPGIFLIVILLIIIVLIINFTISTFKSKKSEP
jgi:hypothetical protein